MHCGVKHLSGSGRNWKGERIGSHVSFWRVAQVSGMFRGHDMNAPGIDFEM
jgi:hypothetical protein